MVVVGMRIKATVEVCDNPECDYEQILDDSGEGATGYHFGKGYWVLAGGGPIPAFYAHESLCIVPAMQYVMDEDRRQN